MEACTLADTGEENAGRVAWVVGGSADVGAATCIELARRGAKVLVTDADPATTNAAADAVISTGGTALAFPAEPGSNEALAEAFQRGVEALGPVDILVQANTGAGPTPAWGEFRTLDPDAMLRAISGLLHPVLVGTRLVIDEMVAGGYGKVVLVTTVAAHLGARGASAYAMALASLGGLTRSLAKEVGASGVNVNSIMFGGLGGYSRSPDREAQLRSFSHLARLGDYSEAANAIAFLCSDEASYLSGSTMMCDGGITLSALV
jgi:NAD(P)-dependent dehydrogenase (short-subunit alcohol dehydrogenase family)